MAFKDNLLRIRELRGKKPPEVIQGSGVAKQQYYAYESGEYKPSNENLEKLSRYFKVPLSLFFKETEITEDDVAERESDYDWFKRTIETLIHQNGETIHEFRERSKDEILNLRGTNKSLLDLLTVQLKPSQDGK